MLQLRSRLSMSEGVVVAAACLLASVTLVVPGSLRGQTAGEGTITGTVSDSTGAVVNDATVTANNAATGIATERKTSSAGIYTISPLPVGTYTVTVVAK